MVEVRQTEEFAKFLTKLRDSRAKAKIAARIDRLRFGNPGDAAPVGEGISELRIDFGPGYRVYFVKKKGDVLIVLLCGGDKSTQEKDIQRAKVLAQQWRA